VQIGGPWKDLLGETTADSYHNNTIRRTFALKLAVGHLPTLARQHKWSKDRYPTDRCCRCDRNERETWKHVLECADNGEDKSAEARRFVSGRVAAVVTKINEERMSATSPRRPVDVWRVAGTTVPTDVLKDIGCLLGRMDDRVINALKVNRLNSRERCLVLYTIAIAALEFARTSIWTPRCKRVRDLLGSWNTRLRQQQQEAQTATAIGPRQRAPGSQQYVGVSGAVDSAESTTFWGSINNRVFDINHYLSMVAPSWAY